MFTGLSASLSAMMAALATSITACVIVCVMHCSATIFALAFFELPCIQQPASSILSLPHVRLLAFYSQDHLILLALKDDNTNDSF